jgi:predicted transcriptional regulator
MRPKSPTLTAHELELMKVIWRREEPVTVRDVYEDLRKQRTVAYTTVLTNMKTLEQKGYLRARQHERAHVYEPARPKHEVIRQMVRDFVTRVFNGAGQPLVVHLLEDDHLSQQDLRDITRMMAKGKKR